MAEKMEVDQNGQKKSKSNNSAAAGSHYRVKISGLPRFYTPTDPLLLAFKKMLHDEMGLTFKYIRSPKKGNSWLYITFFNQTMQEKALKLLRNYVWQGRSLICTLVVADVLKRKQEDGDEGAAKKPRLDIPIEEQMLMATIPYHSISYQEQLSKKNEEAACLFKWLAECMEKKTPELIGYIDQEVAKNVKTRLPFKLDDVRASPVIDGYRNKCEFRIGSDPETKKIVIGYRVDNQEDDLISVAPPDSLRHLPKQMIDIVKVFEKYVQESEFKPQLVNHDTGVWRLLHVRVNKLGHIMVVVMINPTILTPEQLTLLKQDLITFFTSGAASEFNIVSLYLHSDNDIKIVSGTLGGDKSKRPQGQLELLWGAERMEEQLLEFSMDIDPNFYFQNNTHGAEVLYKAILELGDVDKETIVLDLCCGSGGMGMMFAPHCKEVIGVEVMDVNVDDAKRLATKNGLTNCDFLQGAVDDLFPDIEARLKGQKVVAILDPPRTGISAQNVNRLRQLKEIEKLIFIGSSHRPPTKDLLDLSNLEKKSDLDIFLVKHIIPVDLSPCTMRVDFAILCERTDPTELPKSTRKPQAKPKAKNSSKNKNNRSKISSAYNKGRNMNYSASHISLREARSNFFPTEEMMRNFTSSNIRKSKSIDYQKRDSLYPVPLRGNLYQGDDDRPYYAAEEYHHPEHEDFRYTPSDDFRFLGTDSGYSQRSRNYPGAPTGSYIRRAGDRNEARQLERYNNFRRDLEDALDETSRYQPKRVTSRKLAYANALLEEGIRLASEVMVDDYPTQPYRYGQRSARSSRYPRY